MAADAPPSGPVPVDAIRRDLIAIGLEDDLDAAPALAAYLELLERWNRTYNLTGAKDAIRIREQLVDCIAAVPALRRIFAAASPYRVLDVGSGAGLPGVVFAILHPAWQVDCVDAVGKKAAFIRQSAGQLNLSNLRSLHARVESLGPSSANGYDLITSRAFSSLRTLVDLTRSLKNAEGTWVALKGKTPTEELDALPEDIVIRTIQKIELPGSKVERCIVLLEAKSPRLTRE